MGGTRSNRSIRLIASALFKPLKAFRDDLNRGAQRWLNGVSEAND
jgi:hypothetical protein